MKHDSTERIRRDFTAYVEKSGIYLEVTYDTEYLRHRLGTGNGRTDVEVEWIDILPIKVQYSDTQDVEHSWLYGENMPHRIVNALEHFEDELMAQITTRAKESP